MLSYAGASYDCRARDEFEAMAEQERALTVEAAERLRAESLRCDIVSVGSTPTLRYASNLEGVTEVRAGVYVFGDLVQAELGTCAMDDIAIGVLASVIGQSPAWTRADRRGLSSAEPNWGMSELPLDWGYGAVCDPMSGEAFDDVILSSTNQEHGIITSRWGDIGFDNFPGG